MDENQLISEAVVVFPYEDSGNEGNTEMVEAVPCGDDKGSKKGISDMDEEALLLKECNKKVSTEKNIEEIVEEVLYEYGDSANKASSEMDVEALTLEEDYEKTTIKNNIDAVSTEDTNKARSEEVEALHTEDNSNYVSSDSMCV